MICLLNLCNFIVIWFLDFFMFDENIVLKYLDIVVRMGLWYWKLVLFILSIMLVSILFFYSFSSCFENIFSCVFFMMLR